MQDFVSFIQQHLTLSLMVVAVLILLVILEFIKIKRGTTRISPQKAVQLINHNNATVVDIRSVDAFKNGHIINSINVSFGNAFAENAKKIEKFKTQPILLVCATGIESPRAAAILEKKGFNIQLLNGGIRAWEQAGMPLVKR